MQKKLENLSTSIPSPQVLLHSPHSFHPQSMGPLSSYSVIHRGSASPFGLDLQSVGLSYSISIYSGILGQGVVLLHLRVDSPVQLSPPLIAG